MPSTSVVSLRNPKTRGLSSGRCVSAWRIEPRAQNSRRRRARELSRNQSMHMLRKAAREALAGMTLHPDAMKIFNRYAKEIYRAERRDADLVVRSVRSQRDRRKPAQSCCRDGAQTLLRLRPSNDQARRLDGVKDDEQFFRDRDYWSDVRNHADLRAELRFVFPPLHPFWRSSYKIEPDERAFRQRHCFLWAAQRRVQVDVCVQAPSLTSLWRRMAS